MLCPTGTVVTFLFNRLVYQQGVRRPLYDYYKNNLRQI